ncbi:unnamed protein product [Fraxinus pennsylvanica]|uniref:Uncharacterized protein n=1 Tax=Fraxinus pennsylvanica TaxID=56036 RepID=A0AAD1ZZ78_9LAMI|nr:unnamed protein product [Fraxinus pennsylvanica]
MFGCDLMAIFKNYAAVSTLTGVARRSIELSCFNCYGELVSELDKIFEFNDALIDGSSSWRPSYTDGGRDKMFGDCSWKEFRAIVKKMFICPKDVAHSAHSMAPV